MWLPSFKNGFYHLPPTSSPSTRRTSIAAQLLFLMRARGSPRPGAECLNFFGVGCPHTLQDSRQEAVPKNLHVQCWKKFSGKPKGCCNFKILSKLLYVFPLINNITICPRSNKKTLCCASCRVAAFKPNVPLVQFQKDKLSAQRVPILGIQMILGTIDATRVICVFFFRPD